MARSKNTEHRKKQIVEGMRKAMSQSGYDKASIAEIAKYAGLTQGLIHYHFRNKKEILFALLEHLKKQMLQKLENCNAQEYIEVFLSTKQADPEALSCWIAIGMQAIKDHEVKEVYGKAISDLILHFTHVLEQKTNKDQESSYRLALLVFATIQGYFFIAATTKEIIPPGSAVDAVKQMLSKILDKEL